jgi:hypothetical protein
MSNKNERKKLNPIQKKLAKKFLLAVIKGNLTVLDSKEHGICANLMFTEGMINIADKSCGSTYDFVSGNCSDWKHFSGSRLYPVSTQFSTNGLWEGIALELRQSLCQHLLTKLG